MKNRTLVTFTFLLFTLLFTTTCKKDNFDEPKTLYDALITYKWRTTSLIRTINCDPQFVDIYRNMPDCLKKNYRTFQTDGETKHYQYCDPLIPEGIVLTDNWWLSDDEKEIRIYNIYSGFSTTYDILSYNMNTLILCQDSIVQCDSSYSVQITTYHAFR